MSGSVASQTAPALDRQSRPTGVYRTTWGNRYFVQIRHNGVLYYLGTHETIEEAVAVRDAAREQFRAEGA